MGPKKKVIPCCVQSFSILQPGVVMLEHKTSTSVHYQRVRQQYIHLPGNPGFRQTVRLDVNTVSHFEPVVIVTQLLIVLTARLRSTHLNGDVLSFLNVSKTCIICACQDNLSIGFPINAMNAASTETIQFGSCCTICASILIQITLWD